MPDVGDRMYESARDALAEQERQVAQLRSRGPALIAAGAVVATLLVKPIFEGAHPSGYLEWIAAVIGLVGAMGVLVFVVLLLSLYELGFSLNAAETYRAVFDQGLTTQPLLDLTLATTLEERRRLNERVVARLRLWLAGALVCLVAESLGLAAAAALAS